MQVTFYTITDDNNVINKTLGSGESKDVVDIDGTMDVLKPTFRIRKGELSKSPLKYNYCYIGSPYNRYYYMNAKQPTINHIFECQCNVDVLMSFKEEILQQQAIVERSAKYYNTYITDESYTIQNRTRTQTIQFPNGFETDNLILVCAG